MCTVTEKTFVCRVQALFFKVWSFAAEYILAIHSISAFFWDVDDLYVRGHHGAMLEPSVYSDKQHINISSSESFSVHLGD